MTKESDKILPASVNMKRGSTASPLLESLLERADIRPENQQTWSELDDLYKTVAESIFDIGLKVNVAIRQINALGIKRNNEIAISVKGLTRDIEEFSEGLLRIKSRHEGFTGPVKDSEELALCLSVFEDYQALNLRFKAVVFPVMLTIAEYLATASNDFVKETKENKDLTDPNVISDLPVKEITQ